MDSLTENKAKVGLNNKPQSKANHKTFILLFAFLLVSFLFTTMFCYGQGNEITLTQDFRTGVGDATFRVREFLNTNKDLAVCDEQKTICYTGELKNFGYSRENGEKKKYSAPFTLKVLVDTRVNVQMICPYVVEEKVICNYLQETKQTTFYDDDIPWSIKSCLNDILDDIADNIRDYVNKDKRNELKLDFEVPEEMNYIVDDNSVTYYSILKSEKGLPKEELFRIAENFFTYHYRSGKDVIQSRDPERFSITGMGKFGDVNHIHSWGTGIDEDYSAPHIVTIECRDGRVRASVTISELDVVRHGNKYVKSGSYTVNVRPYVPFGDDGNSDLKETIIKVEDRIKGLFDSIQKAIDEGNNAIDAMDDW